MSGASTATANKIAMSRALGAAFLSHQVEQLEKSVNTTYEGRGRNDWQGGRDRKDQTANNYQYRQRTSPQAQNYGANTNKGAPVSTFPVEGRGVLKIARRGGETQVLGKGGKEGNSEYDRFPVTPTDYHSRRKSPSEERVSRKDADVIVLDASVLVNALYQVKKWCKEGREEIIIVPLEALNTLDLLKKGTSALAQRARAASRILESQVGTNPRIRVQSDDAFVLWDKINFKDASNVTIPESEYRLNGPSQPSPEWVRRTVCCASYEFENPATTLNSNTSSNAAPKTPARVALAVLSAPPNLSPKGHHLKLSNEAVMNPVPLPAPSVSKVEPRSSGTLVSYWAARAGIKMLEIDPTAPPQALNNHNSNTNPSNVRYRPHGGGGAAKMEEEERPKRFVSNSNSNININAASRTNKGRRTSYNDAPPTILRNSGSGLVERPPAVMAMMEMVAAKSNSSRPIKVLARGEKLDPDS